MIVSVTHRLNVFGYLYLGHLGGDEYRDSGCVGLLDVVAALRWVNENIASFGGDPDNVTLFGESAGGAKIACLLAMPAARGLFHRGVIQSGADAAGGFTATLEEAEFFTTELMRTLSLERSQWRRLTDVAPEELVQAHEAVSVALGRAYNLPPPGPTIDGATLPAAPIECVETGAAVDVPLILGACRDEVRIGVALSSDVLADGAQPTRPPRPTVPAAAGGTAAGGTGPAALERWLGGHAKRVIDAYRKSRPDAPFSDIEAAIRGDRQFLVPSLRLAEAQLRYGEAPVYVYSLDWKSDYVPELGAYHSMDIRFFFSNTGGSPVMSNDPSSAGLASRMSDALVSFARTGNPNHPSLPEWPTFSVEQRATMIFDREPHVDDDPRGAEISAWDAVPTSDLGF